MVMDVIEPDTATPQEASKRTRQEHERIRQALPEFIGLSIDEATELARHLGIRLSLIDVHDDSWGTLELQFTRMTLYTEKGRVVRGVAG